jgi:hypothetical protein
LAGHSGKGGDQQDGQDKNNFQFHKISRVKLFVKDKRERETTRRRRLREFLGAGRVEIVSRAFGAGHTTGVSGEISEEPDAIPRKDRRRLRGQKN